MTLKCFEGAAGTGKTHNIIEEARAVIDQVVVKEHHRMSVFTDIEPLRFRCKGASWFSP